MGYTKGNQIMEEALCKHGFIKKGNFTTCARCIEKETSVSEKKSLSSWIKTSQHPLAPYCTVNAIREAVLRLKDWITKREPDDVWRNIQWRIDEIFGEKLI